MDTKQFLETVVPSGTLCIADHVEIEGKKVFVHHVFDNPTDAASFALWLDSRDGEKTVYYALASFKDTFLNDSGKRRVKRTVKNVDKLKSIWLDIDFKDIPAVELVPKLAQFLKDTKMPKPTFMVNSGNGIHLYWSLHESITLDVWAPLAEGLKALCKAHDLPADHACTSDAARVLRPPGTHNRKYDEKPVKIIGGDGTTYSYEQLQVLFPKADISSIPAHLRGVVSNSREFTGSNHAREVDAKQVFKTCNVMREALTTGGKDHIEPQWNLILSVLRFLPGGGKFIHAVSQGHIDYTPAGVAEKWQQKMAADMTGPPLCATLETHFPGRCNGCPIYQSKKHKIPLATGYHTPEPQPPAVPNPGTPIPNTGNRLVSVNAANVQSYPNGWRPLHGGSGVERKVFDPKSGEWEWERVLRRTWKLAQAQKSATTGEYTYIIEAKTTTGKPISFEIPGALAYGCPKTWEILGGRGAILTSNEKSHWTDLMATWLQSLQEQNAVLDTTDQLGWIERVNDKDEKNIVGFASGAAAFFNDGSAKKSVVTANHKHKGIADYYTPVGKASRWMDVCDFFTKQGHDHILLMLASAFAGPLVKFTGQSGTILSIVSTGSGAGKSLSMETAAAVWGSPKLGSMTLNDTPTTVKNKIAYLQNITAYWDEVRGDERTLHNFIETAFQVTQGKDRERADRSARTIAAQTWHTMLVVTSNESIFDLASSETKDSDAGVYRIFEASIAAGEKPEKDPAIASMVAELQNHYGFIGEAYAQYLANNVAHVQKRVGMWVQKLEAHFKAESAERFWIATMASLIVGVELANKAGLANFDQAGMVQYLQKKFIQLRTRVVKSRSSTDPKELLVAYMMQHQHERLVVDKLSIGRGGKHTPQIIGNAAAIRKVTYQVGKEQNILRVVKSDFSRWLYKSRNGLRLSGDLADRFGRECGMSEHKAILGAGTQFATSRAICLDFNIETEELEIE